ncbi:hypothetical protein [Streptomyces sp. NBC_00503]|uniref:hypothetical protein n=1 Tax=Streptomyces sp. NBC_00503 TaxID=2903659 RepID=UPI002E80EB64|nr:hypothetical protein [Streptomyces sp. NBC_00503]WUD79720.1 hypothetical protein OG490_03510 [Streptomyces sp. NBC_00503]
MRSRAARTEPGTSGTVHACLRTWTADCPLGYRAITDASDTPVTPSGSPTVSDVGGHAVIVGHAQRVLQLLRSLRLLEGIVSLPRSRKTSPNHTDPFQRRFLEPGHTATPAHRIQN